jgi:hypothetical protein
MQLTELASSTLTSNGFSSSFVETDCTQPSHKLQESLDYMDNNTEDVGRQLGHVYPIRHEAMALKSSRHPLLG